MTRDECREIALSHGWTVFEDVVDLVMAVAAAEREACAAVAEDTAAGVDAEAIAEAIRARSNA